MRAPAVVATDDTRTYLSPEELSDLIGVPVRTLGRWRSQRTGPLFLRMGVHVRYRREDVDDWVAHLVDNANEWMDA
jgi:excisionase family DNA binding protein